MRVLGLFERGNNLNFADTYIYTWNQQYSHHENAFLISNQVATTIIIYLSDTIITEVNKAFDLLNSNGIPALIIRKDHIGIFTSSNFTYDWQHKIVYFHEYTYYKNNEFIVSDEFWLHTNINELLPYKLLYYERGMRKLYDGEEYTLYNTATDDDILYKYIYEKETIMNGDDYLELYDDKNFRNFVHFMRLLRMRFAVPFDQLSNRITRSRAFFRSKIHIGLRNESIPQALDNINSQWINYSANGIMISELKGSGSYSEKRISEFDIGQFKNYMNFLTLMFYIKNMKKRPSCTIIGAAPGYWIPSMKRYFTIITYDDKVVDSTEHHNKYFSEEDITKVKTNGVYIDVRSDFDTNDWKKRRRLVEEETQRWLDISYKLLEGKYVEAILLKMTAMDLEIPDGYFVHFPTTYRKSEYYLLIDKQIIKKQKVKVTKSLMYNAINTIYSDNVFISGKYSLRGKTEGVLALYCLSNTINPKDKVIQYANSFSGTCMTVRLNNTYEVNKIIDFKTNADYTFLPSDFTCPTNTILTSYRGYTGVFGYAITKDLKSDGNNHIYIIPNARDENNFDTFASHLGLSRYSHSKRFSESATTMSGYLFRDMVSGKEDMEDTDKVNYASGHVFNAIAHYRFDYTYDIIGWLRLHKTKQFRVKSDIYEEHTYDEVRNAIEAAYTYYLLDGDRVGKEYAKKVMEIWEIQV
nr:viral structural protein 3 [Rotavirus C]QUD20769.1 viral structural protein 3 [Rotavirus C]QUD20770.1 viral structural protein 3 [Rotavirus C]QUD20776.1 viral structural protein 3 [Rotavirus C]QUD20778.1 viral structural protein 3 [Rotavirus C]